MKTSVVTLMVLGLIAMFLAGCTQQSATGGYYKFTGNKMVDAKFVNDAPVTLETAPYEKMMTLMLLLRL